MPKTDQVPELSLPQVTAQVLGGIEKGYDLSVANALEAVKQSGVEVEVIKVEDIEEMMKYNILVTPVLLVDDVAKIKGRIAQVNEIKDLLSQS